MPHFFFFKSIQTLENGLGIVVTFGFPHPGLMRSPGQERVHADGSGGSPPGGPARGSGPCPGLSDRTETASQTRTFPAASLQHISQGPDSTVSSSRIPTNKVEIEKS